jgi:hypothetical protein
MLTDPLTSFSSTPPSGGSPPRSGPPSNPEANTCTLGREMFLAGLPVRDDLILELARLVDDEALAERLESA